MTQTTTQTTARGPAIKSHIQAFGAAYHYDASYLAELYDASPGAYRVFAAAQAMSSFRETVPVDAHFVARVVAMQAEDCGPCTQLNLRMAVEAGVDRNLLATLLESPEQLPGPLRDVRAHVRAVTSGEAGDPECAARLVREYGDAALAELAVCIAGCRMYPTVKRALLKDGVCEILSLDF